MKNVLLCMPALYKCESLDSIVNLFEVKFQCFARTAKLPKLSMTISGTIELGEGPKT